MALRYMKVVLAFMTLAATFAAWSMFFPHHLPLQEEELPLWDLSFVKPLDPLVHDVLAEMGVGKPHLLRWRDEHPSAAIRHLWRMEQEDQRNVALVARYIRDINGTISADVAWLEASALVHYSRKYDMPLELAVAVANTESHFRPGSLSDYGAMGVMQVVWRIHQGLLFANGITSDEELYNPDRGIAAGCLLLSRYLRDSGSEERALARYSGDPLGKYWQKVTRNAARFRLTAMAEM